MFNELGLQPRVMYICYQVLCKAAFAESLSVRCLGVLVRPCRCHTDMTVINFSINTT